MKELVFMGSDGAMLALAVVLGLTGCATESHQAVQPQKPASAGTVYNGPKSTLMVANFDNRSTYLRGLFSDSVDRLGGAGQDNSDWRSTGDRPV